MKPSSTRPWFVLERLGDDYPLERFLVGVLAIVVPVSREATAVREQVADGHLIAVGAAPLLDVRADRVIERDPAVLDRPHQERSGGQDLGQRCEIEDGRRLHRASVRAERQTAEGLRPERLGGIADFNDSSGKREVSDGVAKDAARRFEALRHHAVSGTRKSVPY